jgi:hypothetical protein
LRRLAPGFEGQADERNGDRSHMNRHLILIALVVAATTGSAGAEPQAVRGNQFIAMMQSNTLSGTIAAGDAFNIYFLPGGAATYEDATGTRGGGSWHIDEEGDVCVAWQNPADRQEGCFRVTVDGSKVAWEGKAGSGRAVLRGGVNEMTLKGVGQ